MSSTTSTPLTVGIAGLTGKFGLLLAHELLRLCPTISLRGFIRDPSKLPNSLTSHSNLTLYTGDALSPSSLAPFVTGCSIVICCYLGPDTLMLDGQKLLIDACEEAGVARYVASDWALDYTKLKLGELFVKDPMIHVKAYLETKEKVKGVHVLVGGFMEPFFSPMYGIVGVEGDGKEVGLKFWGEGDEVWEGTTYENAAEYTATVVLDEDAVGVKRFIGGTMTVKSLAKSLEDVYGVKVNLHRLGSQQELFETMHKIKNETPYEFFKYMTLFFTYYMINGQTRVGPERLDESYPDVKPVGWEEYLHKFESVEELIGGYFKLAEKK